MSSLPESHGRRIFLSIILFGIFRKLQINESGWEKMKIFFILVFPSDAHKLTEDRSHREIMRVIRDEVFLKADNHRAGRKRGMTGLNITGNDNPIKKPVTWARVSVFISVSRIPSTGPCDISS